ncbi:hypothetical protein [Paeniglutamicibacter sp. NPDC091659]|uniref:hypothetical protein n=1 Tax=Paeniglutamicibacter sp. NPDC091659 TaxID=3364389 RepID=UPI00381EF5C2
MKIIAVMCGATVVGFGSLLGIGAFIAQHPPEDTQSFGHAIYVASLSHEDKGRIVTDEIKEIRGVASAIMDPNDKYGMKFKVTINESATSDATQNDIRDACDLAYTLSNSFDPPDVVCSIAVEKPATPSL